MNFTQKIYLNILYSIANSDGIFKSEEEDLILEYSRKIGVEEFEIDQLEPLDDILNSLGALPYRTKTNIIQDIVSIIVVDNDIHEKEVIEAELFAVRLGFKKSVIQELLDCYDPYTKRFPKIKNIFHKHDPFYH